MPSGLTSQEKQPSWNGSPGVWRRERSFFSITEVCQFLFCLWRSTHLIQIAPENGSKISQASSINDKIKQGEQINLMAWIFWAVDEALHLFTERRVNLLDTLFFSGKKYGFLQLFPSTDPLTYEKWYMIYVYIKLTWATWGYLREYLNIVQDEVMGRHSNARDWLNGLGSLHSIPFENTINVANTTTHHPNLGFIHVITSIISLFGFISHILQYCHHNHHHHRHHHQ